MTSEPRCPDAVAERLISIAAGFADIVQEADGAAPPPDRIASLAVHVVPGTEAAAVLVMREHRSPVTAAATDEAIGRLDALQCGLGEGPGIDAMHQLDVVSAPDLRTQERWPAFVADAECLGYRSLLSTRLSLAPGHRGALTLAATAAGGLDDAGQAATVFASYASVALSGFLQRNRALHLERALATNRDIGIAIGILMARDLCTRDEAFARLRSASQYLHRRLREVAEDVIETGVLPERPERPRRRAAS